MQRSLGAKQYAMTPPCPSRTPAFLPHQRTNSRGCRIELIDRILFTVKTSAVRSEGYRAGGRKQGAGCANRYNAISRGNRLLPSILFSHRPHRSGEHLVDSVPFDGPPDCWMEDASGVECKFSPPSQQSGTDRHRFEPARIDRPACRPRSQAGR